MSIAGFYKDSGPSAPFTMRLALILLWMCHAASSFALEWGASASETYMDTRGDSTRTGILDQQYQFHANGELLPTVSYFTLLNYRHLQTRAKDSSAVWQSELMPSVSAVWSAPFFRLRSDYSYRDNRDQLNVNQLKGQSANVVLQSDWESLPRLTGRYQWIQNVNDLELLGVDTRQRTIGGSADYSFSTTSLRYEFNDIRTENRRTGFEQISRNHIGRLENSLSVWKHIVSVQTSYMIQAKADREQRASEDGILVRLTPLSGLWSNSPTPELGALDGSPGLIDGNLDSAATHAMDLSGNDVQNLGLDFGSAITVDHIFVYTDSLANSGLRWALYTSSDNYTWSLVRGNQTYPFNVVFRRYEIDFPVQTARYVKVVSEPQPLQIPVYVTEIRGLLTRSQSTGFAWATDHHAAVRVGVQPATWVSGAVEGTLIKNGASATTIGRQQDGLNGSLHLSAHKMAGISGQYQWSRTEYPDATGGRTDTELLGMSVISRWLNGLQSTVAGSRQREVTGNALNRRQDAATVRLDAAFFPGLGGATEGGLTEDHRFLAADVYKTRYIGQAIQAQPTSRFQFTVDYRYYWLSSQRAWTIPTRENIALSATYRLTETLQLSGSASRYHDPVSSYETWQGLINWNATEKLVLSASVDGNQPDRNNRTVVITTQGIFRFSSHGDVSASYSHLDSQQSARENFSNLRLGFTFRI
ncbi:MAG TPA: discoidin domain-containing protein [bacterium]